MCHMYCLLLLKSPTVYERCTRPII
uniref:Uncharacterized protein n=1 Tax=Arundo donax TaxID=35708 RepID=A0A0A8ZFA1_ARUDO